MKYVAFIGSRNWARFLEEERETFRAAIYGATAAGFGVVTGGAAGADQIAIVEALRAAAAIRVVLPWETYERDWLAPAQRVAEGRGITFATEVYDTKIHSRWTESVFIWHPAVGALTREMIALHARNAGIIEVAEAVVALPNETKRGGGGTGQGMRLATAWNRPLFDFTRAEDRLRWKAWLADVWVRRAEIPEAPA